MSNRYFLLICYFTLTLNDISLASNILDKLIPSESNQVINPLEIKKLDLEKDITNNQSNIDSAVKEVKSQENIKLPDKNIQKSIEDKTINQTTSDNIKSESNTSTEYIDISHQYKLSRINYSVMFTLGEIDLINKIINDEIIAANQLRNADNSNQKIDQPNSVNTVAKESIIEKPKVIPSFYLGSIIYRNNDDWTIWINGIQLQKPMVKNIKIDENNIIDLPLIDKKYIVIKWRTKFLDDYSPNWKSKFSYKDGIGYYSKDSNIIIDENLETVTFELKVNQSFAVKDMAIFEGLKLSSSIISNETTQNNKK